MNEAEKLKRLELPTALPGPNAEQTQAIEEEMGKLLGGSLHWRAVRQVKQAVILLQEAQFFAAAQKKRAVRFQRSATEAVP